MTEFVELSMRKIMNGIQETIRKYLVAVYENEGIEVPVVFAEQSVPQPPSPPYVAFKMLTGLIKTGTLDEQIPETDTTPYKVRAQRNFTVQITCVGKATEDNETTIRATDLAASIQNSLDLPSFRGLLQFPSEEGFEGGNLTPIIDNAIVDATVALETDAEPRAIYDITFAIAFETTDDISRIETIEFQGAVDTNMDGNFDKAIGPVTVN